MALFGRERESRRIADLLDGVPGRGGTLLMCGAAGVGKSALLDEAAARARDRGMMVLSTTGVQAEVNLPFAALHRLLRPLLPRAADLAAAQRAAILAAFGQSDAPSPDWFLIALAVLELLTEAAGETPLLLLADDAHRLDRCSAEVLGFVSRRVCSDPIVVLGATQEADCPPFTSGLERIFLGGLDERASRLLLRTRFPDLAPAVRERLVCEAEGNPLALLELPTLLSGSLREGRSELPRHLPMTARLGRAFAARVAGLPPVTRMLIQVAAIDDSSVLTEILQAAEAAGAECPEMSDFDPAVDAGVIYLDGPAVRFHHPLVRSAVYQDSTITERRAVHRALAAVLEAEPDRGVWHRASAAVDRDAQVAAELQAAAERAGRRGDLLTAVTAFERAAELTKEGPRRGSLLLSAAEAAHELGRIEKVRGLLRRVGMLDLGPAERARAMWLGDAFRGGSTRDPAVVDGLVQTAGAMAVRGDLDIALNLLAIAAVRCRFGNLSGDTVTRLVATTEGSGVLPADPRRLHILATAAPLESGADVLCRLSAIDVAPEDPRILHLLAVAANDVGAFHHSASLCEAAATRLREQGRFGLLSRVLATRSWASIMAGDFSAAAIAARESAGLAGETEQPAWQMQAWTAQSALAALRGDHDEAEELAVRIESAALPLGAAFNLALVQYARGMSALGRGEHAEAYKQLHRVFESADPAHHDLFTSFGIGDLAEAAAHCGHAEEGRELLGRTEVIADRIPSPWVRATIRFAKAQLADDDDAESEYRRALSDAELLRWPFLQARLHLGFGEWLRRQRRTVESRSSLRTARDAFDALGVTPWSDRARKELRAAGETGRWRGSGTLLDVLTAQELQIVQLAAQGLSNREIGQRLYLSHRTVESHLYRAFPKLGINSRAQLPAALGSPVGVRHRADEFASPGKTDM